MCICILLGKVSFGGLGSGTVLGLPQGFKASANFPGMEEHVRLAKGCTVSFWPVGQSLMEGSCDTYSDTTLNDDCPRAFICLQKLQQKPGNWNIAVLQAQAKERTSVMFNV